MRHWLIGLLALAIATAAPAQTAGGGVAPPAVEAMGAQLPYGTLSGWGE